MDDDGPSEHVNNVPTQICGETILFPEVLRDQYFVCPVTDEHAQEPDEI